MCATFGNGMCTGGPADAPGNWPYRAMHNMLLAHADVVHLYRYAHRTDGLAVTSLNDCLLIERLVVWW